MRAIGKLDLINKIGHELRGRYTFNDLISQRGSSDRVEAKLTGAPCCRQRKGSAGKRSSVDGSPFG
jgi:hypothetical protein